jgi:tetratricopeptide (TPR) repeat protein
MLRAQQFKITTFISVLLVVYAHAVQADSLQVFVNDTFVKAGTTIQVLPNSIVNYEIYQSSPEPIELDLTGDGTLKQMLFGSKVTFAAVYNDGNYKPKIKSGSEVQSFKLSVFPSLQVWKAEITKIVPQIMWPLVVLCIFLILCFWGELHKLIKSFRIGTIEVSGIKMTSADLEVSLRQEIEKTVQNLEKEFPPEMAPQYMQFSIDPEAGHYVHIVEFLKDIGFKVKSAKAWNSVGNYYFYQNADKAYKAYLESICLDPDDPTPHINLGMFFHLIKHDLYTAQKWFKTGIELATKKGMSVGWAHLGLASVYGELKKKQTAPDDIRRAEEKRIYHTTQAKTNFKLATELNGADFWANFGLGWCFFKEDNIDMAIRYTSAALDLKSDFVVARYNLALQKARSREPKEGLEDLYKLLEPIRLQLQSFGFEKDPDLQKLADESDFKQFRKILDLSYST